MSDHTRIGPGHEFDLIREMVRRWGPRARGIGDDAAILDVPPGERLVVSTDSSVENIHFRRSWLSPEEIGFRATAAALSDLAAMAAAPLGLVVAMSAPRDWHGELGALADGIGEAAASCGTPIVGGDMTRSDELAITVTVFGSAQRPIRRDGARVDDSIFVTGALGGPGEAVAALYAGRQPDRVHRQRFARPTPRIREGQWLAARGATALIDISDGLASDVAHLSAASGATARIDLELVPILRGTTLERAARSGEEYELVVTAPHAFDSRAFERAFGIPLTAIGRMEGAHDGSAHAEVYLHGARVALPRGHDHFST